MATRRGLRSGTNAGGRSAGALTRRSRPDGPAQASFPGTGRGRSSPRARRTCSGDTAQYLPRQKEPVKLRVICTGTRPLLMNNVQTASPLNPYAKKLKALSSKRVKTDDDRWQMARVEFEAAMYYNPELGPYMPSENLLRSLTNGARIIKAGKKIERGLVINDLMMPLIYEGPRTIEELWGGGNSPHVDIRLVTIARNKIDRCRPIFPKWLIEAEVLIDPQAIDYEEFVQVARIAGEMEGLGDFRQVFGRYQVQVEPV